MSTLHDDLSVTCSGCGLHYPNIEEFRHHRETQLCQVLARFGRMDGLRQDLKDLSEKLDVYIELCQWAQSKLE